MQATSKRCGHPSLVDFLRKTAANCKVNRWKKIDTRSWPERRNWPNSFRSQAAQEIVTQRECHFEISIHKKVSFFSKKKNILLIKYNFFIMRSDLRRNLSKNCDYCEVRFFQDILCFYANIKSLTLYLLVATI